MKNIICAKWGDYYNAEYVNNLYGMVKRNITPPFRFICLTDDPSDIREEVEVHELENKELIGWWCKIEFFKSPLYDIEGSVLTLDLDLLIVDNIDGMFEYRPKKFCMAKDFGFIDGLYYGNNSGIMRLEAGEHSEVHDELNLEEIDHATHHSEHNFKNHEYWGDQCWISIMMEDETTIWPEHWIRRYVRQCHKYENGNLDDYDFFIPNGCKIIMMLGTTYKNHNQLHKIGDIWQP